jgi:hypothetical protein
MFFRPYRNQRAPGLDMLGNRQLLDPRLRYPIATTDATAYSPV